MKPFDVLRYARGGFTPEQIFIGSDQGAWLSSKNFNLLFQDAAGSVAVTAVEQPIGFALDFSKGLASSNPFTAVGWTNAGSTWDTLTDLGGGSFTATKSTAGATDVANSSTGITLVVGDVWEITIDVTSTTLSSWNLGIYNTTNSRNVAAANFSGAGIKKAYVVINSATGVTGYIGIITTVLGTINVASATMRKINTRPVYQTTPASRLLLSAKVNLLINTNTLSTQNVTTTAVPYTLNHTGSGTITLSGASTAGPLVGPGSLTFTPTAGTLTLTVSGSVTNAQLEYGTVATGYQWNTNATTYDTAGFPQYFGNDAIDDFLRGLNVCTVTPDYTIMVLASCGVNTSKVTVAIATVEANSTTYTRLSRRYDAKQLRSQVRNAAGNTTTVASNGSWPDNVYKLMFVQTTANDIKLYDATTLVKTSAHAVTPWTGFTLGNFCIAGDTNTGLALPLKIQEVLFINRAISATEMQNLATYYAGSYTP